MSYINYLSAVQIVEKNLIYTHKLYPQNIKYIKDAESNLGVKFPKSYIEFLLKYGILDIGSREIHGLDYTKDYSNYLYYNIELQVFLTLKAKAVLISRLMILLPFTFYLWIKK